MNRLTKLANKYKTDKGTEHEFEHGFTEFYEPFFSKYENPTILSLGVGVGGSEKMLSRYFDENCKIYCVDIDDVSDVFEGMNNVRFYQADLGIEDEVIRLANLFKGIKFDIIIDDASHLPGHQFLSMLYFSNLLSKNGIFVVEDLHSSYFTYTDITYEETPLAFLSSLKKTPFFLSEEEYNKFVGRIRDIFIYNHRNTCKNEDCRKMMDKDFKNRSITAIITFDNE